MMAGARTDYWLLVTDLLITDLLLSPGTEGCRTIRLVKQEIPISSETGQQRQACCPQHARIPPDRTFNNLGRCNSLQIHAAKLLADPLNHRGSDRLRECAVDHNRFEIDDRDCRADRDADADGGLFDPRVHG